MDSALLIYRGFHLASIQVYCRGKGIIVPNTATDTKFGFDTPFLAICPTRGETFHRYCKAEPEGYVSTTRKKKEARRERIWYEFKCS
jgi:hypothetical protein